MTSKSFFLPPALHEYLLDHSEPPDAVLRDLMRETRALGDIAVMQIAPEQGAFLTLLARIARARNAVEVGTFTGYSALCIARGLAADGKLLCCDVSEEWTAVARRYWERAGVAGRIALKLAPALDTLRALPTVPSIDFAFLDADKENYIAYYEELVPRLAAGSVLLADNVFWNGAVVDRAASDPTTEAIRAFNAHVAQDARVQKVMLPIADGLSLIYKP